jgi:hypothetical protein
MPWYWSDDIARTLVSQGRLDTENAIRLIASPVALRRDESTVEGAAFGLQDDEEIPLAA